MTRVNRVQLSSNRDIKFGSAKRLNIFLEVGVPLVYLYAIGILRCVNVASSIMIGVEKRLIIAAGKRVDMIACLAATSRYVHLKASFHASTKRILSMLPKRGKKILPLPAPIPLEL